MQALAKRQPWHWEGMHVEESGSRITSTVSRRLFKITEETTGCRKQEEDEGCCPEQRRDHRMGALLLQGGWTVPHATRDDGFFFD